MVEFMNIVGDIIGILIAAFLLYISFPSILLVLANPKPYLLSLKKIYLLLPYLVLILSVKYLDEVGVHFVGSMIWSLLFFYISSIIVGKIKNRIENR